MPRVTDELASKISEDFMEWIFDCFGEDVITHQDQDRFSVEILRKRKRGRPPKRETIESIATRAYDEEE